jgi:hypothetical protein
MTRYCSIIPKSKKGTGIPGKPDRRELENVGGGAPQHSISVKAKTMDV